MGCYINYYTTVSNILFILGGAGKTYEREPKCIQISGKTEGKRKRGRPESRWKDNIYMRLEAEMGVTWTRLIWLKIGIN